MTFTLFTYNPMILGISLVVSLFYSLYYHDFKIFLGNIGFYLFTILFIVLINPLFNHRGSTILFFLNEQAITKESIIFGLAISIALVSIIVWSSIFSYTMDTDKNMYLFSRVSVNLAIIIALVLRFIPEMKRKKQEFIDTQTTLGMKKTKSLSVRLSISYQILLALITWSLEHYLTLSLSMKARGYKQGKRSYYHNYAFKLKDFVLLLFGFLLLAFYIYCNYQGHLYFYYYPVIGQLKINIYSIILFSASFLFMMLPLIYEIGVSLKWHFLRRKI
jgi:energy-coupling factor transport system permease protein